MCFTALPGDSRWLSWRLMRRKGRGDKIQRHEKPVRRSQDWRFQDLCTQQERWTLILTDTEPAFTPSLYRQKTLTTFIQCLLHCACNITAYCLYCVEHNHSTVHTSNWSLVITFSILFILQAIYHSYTRLTVTTALVFCSLCTFIYFYISLYALLLSDQMLNCILFVWQLLPVIES